MNKSFTSSYRTLALSIVAAALLTTVLTSIISLRAASTGQPAPHPLPVSVFTYAEQSSYTATLRLSGLLQAKARAQVAFEIPGLLLDLEAQEGDPVAAGSVLGRLDTRQLQAQKAIATAELNSVDAELQLATLRSERSRQLSASGAVSMQDYDELRLTAQALASRKAAVLASLRSLEIDLEKSTLKAPYTGVVAARYVDPGTVLQAGQLVLQLVSANDLEARIGVPAAHMSQLTPGQPYALQFRTGEFDATLRAVRRDLDVRTGTALAVFDLPSGVNLLDGDIARLTVERSIASTGGWVPISALLEGERGAWTVLRIDPQQDGTAVTLREAVEVLSIDGARAYVKGSLQTGQRVVADGIHRIAAGTPVQPLEY